VGIEHQCADPQSGQTKEYKIGIGCFLRQARRTKE